VHGGKTTDDGIHANEDKIADRAIVGDTRAGADHSVRAESCARPYRCSSGSDTFKLGDATPIAQRPSVDLQSFAADSIVLPIITSLPLYHWKPGEKSVAALRARITDEAFDCRTRGSPNVATVHRGIPDCWPNSSRPTEPGKTNKTIDKIE
jgi:hypothetical protein